MTPALAVVLAACAYAVVQTARAQRGERGTMLLAVVPLLLLAMLAAYGFTSIAGGSR